MIDEIISFPYFYFMFLRHSTIVFYALYLNFIAINHNCIYFMPIFFKTTVKEGSVAGKGVFALQDIPKGAIWWRAWSDEPQFTKDPNCAFNEHTVKDFIATHSH